MDRERLKKKQSNLERVAEQQLDYFVIEHS